MGLGGTVNLGSAQPLPLGDSVSEFVPKSVISLRSTLPLSLSDLVTEFVPNGGGGTKTLRGTISIYVGTVAMRQVSQGGGTIIVVQPTTTFIFRGWDPLLSKYEFWTGSSRNTPNPSGHALQGPTVIGELPFTGIY